MNSIGPGISPWINSPESRMAVAGSPGMPSDRSGIIAPPVTALLAASGATTPAISPRPKRSGVLEDLRAWA